MIQDYNTVQPIVDLFVCVQGEGKLVGVPHILIRTSGCPLRCTFKDTICDTPYSSYYPEKGKYTLNDIIHFVDDNPQIGYAMITGGEPTMHFELLRELIYILQLKNKYVTVETAGSYLTEYLNIDLVSLSPKMNNSVPKLSDLTSQVVINRHNKYRTNYDAMKLLIRESRDYQIKFVISDIADLDEVKEFQLKLQIPNNKIYLMPEGIESEQIITKHLWLLDYCIEFGYNLCDRLQIRYYGNKREA